MIARTNAVSSVVDVSRANARVLDSPSAWRWMACALALVIVPVGLAAEPGQESFVSPEAAVAALVAAVEANDTSALRAVLGTHGEKLMNSGDAVADAKYRAGFINAYRRASAIETKGDALATLVVGKDRWPMPIPLVKSNGAWYFDTKQGEQEVLDRRIGRNELATIQVCLAIVDAQRDYVAKDQDSNGVLEYAAKFVSTPGIHDGLYWEPQPGEPSSPLGPLLAAAAKDGYASAKPFTASPYHGYFYRILTQQGQDAPGGAYDYLVRGRLIGGFAVIAYPARYDVSGVMTFIVNHDGVVYQKDLGPNTAAIVAVMDSFNPDPSWKRPQIQ